MDPISLGIVVLGCALGGASLGMKLRTTLPDESAVFLIMEMDSPFDGVLKVSGDPIMLAIERLNQ